MMPIRMDHPMKRAKFYRYKSYVPFPGILQYSVPYLPPSQEPPCPEMLIPASRSARLPGIGSYILFAGHEVRR